MQSQSKGWYKKWWGILIITITTFILIILVASGFYLFNLIKKIQSGNQEILKQNFTNQKQYNAEGNDNYWLGSTKPKVTIVEFADFACPLCKNSFSKIREISLNYKNDVKIIYRDYPGYEHSLDLAMAARCAGEQGLFWLMHDKLYQHQGLNEKSQLTALANQVGADIDKFDNCLANKKFLNLIQKDFSDAQKLGITGTPTWFINGYKIEGDIPYELFIQIVEKLIKEKF